MLGFYRGKVKFVNINVDETPELAKKFKITTIPTTLLYKNGDHVGTVTGLNVNELMQKMNVMLAEDAAPAQAGRPAPTGQEQPVRGRGGR
jgi:thioredoxin-like negative regulator of GroEL